ncbi:hypothetical protein BDY19DRAFT_990215 [Irpex rosettiformis]|uniref:Uncharacterized protein n=1 Tax=Irpex rosettiformis TaxID=378272 RepID=A0ACB8UE40_9APHY|nr:hypothetical protein BDY19DRAFT_990215 [Irpex rosettiformis]
MALRALPSSLRTALAFVSTPLPRWLPPAMHTTRRTYADVARPRNESIPVERAMVIDRETTKPIGPFSLDTILAGRARAANGRWLEAAELVATNPDPIVKYINIRDEYMKAKAQHQKDRENSRARKTKEIQMTFQTADADMAHKLKKAKEALEQRSKVIIIYSNKKGSARSDEKETKAKIAKTLELLVDVGKESKPHTIMPHGQAMIYLEPSSSK